MDQGQNKDLQEQIRLLQQQIDEQSRAFQQQLDDKSRQLADKSQQLADTSQVLQQQLAEKSQELHQERELHRLSTLCEYLSECHGAYVKMRVQEVKALCSTGTVANPVDKFCPTSLQPWEDFLDLRDTVLEQFFADFPGQDHLFDPRSFTSHLGNAVLSKKIADEKGLEKFLSLAIERPVTAIMSEAKRVANLCKRFKLGEGVTFENHPHVLSEVSENVQEAAASPPLPSTPEGSTPEGSMELGQIRPDQICIYVSETKRRRMVFVCEYKAPHKLTLEHLRIGLHPMNLYEDVAQRRSKMPPKTELEARFKFNAERLTAAAVSQTYHYMLHSGLEYGVLATGPAFVFLKVDWSCPSTLYYHLAEPGPEFDKNPGGGICSSVIAQYFAFSLTTIDVGRIHGQNQRDEAMDNSKTWAGTFEMTLRDIDAKDRIPPEGSPAFSPVVHVRSSPEFAPAVRVKSNRTSFGLRSGRRVALETPTCKPSSSKEKKKDSDSDDESGSGPPDTPCPPPGGRRRQAPAVASSSTQRQDKRKETSSKTSKQAGKQYCTQKCLLGLVQGKKLDAKCPNVARHRCNGATSHHPVTHAQWLHLLSEQLRVDLDNGVDKLYMEGGFGVLFKITMLEFGYTFVAKGTIRTFVKEMKHEAAVYERLGRLQGKSVPVYLGSVDLRDVKRTYFYDHRVYIIYLMFLSWAGDTVELPPTTEERDKMVAKVEQVVLSMHRRGVVHSDVREPNVLYNAEVGRFMLIDFGEASILEKARRPLAPKPSNKRPRRCSDEQATDKFGKRVCTLEDFDRDVRFTRAMFWRMPAREGSSD